MQEPVIILYDNTDPEDKDAPFATEMDNFREVAAVEEALTSLGRESRRLEIHYASLEEDLKQLWDRRGATVFNLCEDIAGQGIYEVYMISFLELLGMTYTGTSPIALGLCLDKARSKEVLSYHGLETPRHYVLTDPSQRRPDLSFPLILKPLHEDGSYGIDRDSVVVSDEALETKARQLLQQFQQPVIVEEYIGGREFNVSLLGEGTPEALPISEIDYSAVEKGEPHILTYASKWDETSLEYLKTPPTCPVTLDPALEKTLKEVALKASQVLGCRDYIRVDIRMRGDDPCVIEVNPNPCISPDAGFVRAAEAAGISYAELIGKIVGFADGRRAQQQKGRTFQNAHSRL